MRLMLVLTLWAASVFAQPAVTRGGALLKRQYQTYGALTLYLDPTGSDSNSCTASGTSACLTLQGVWNKLPSRILHNVTVNVAAGSYTGGSRLDSRTIGNNTLVGTGFSTLTIAPLISVVGPALANVTPTTGTATGTSTSVTSATGTTASLTDTTQTWTTHDLRGYFIVMTSGAAINQTRVIVDNTATTLTLQNWVSTAPSAGDTYAIRKPQAVLAGRHDFTGITGIGTFRLQQLEFNDATVNGNVVLNSNGSFISFQGPLSRFMGASTVVASVSSSQSPPLTASSLTGPTVSGAPFYAANTSSGGAYGFSEYTALGTTAGVYAYSAGGTPVSIGGFSNSVSQLFIIAETGSSTATAILANGYPVDNAGGNATALISARCPSGSTGIGFYQYAGSFSNASVEAVNCGQGFVFGYNATNFGLPFPVRDWFGTLTCTNVTTCMTLQRGARVFLSNPPVRTGVTNDILLDGVTYTDTFFEALSPIRITGNAGSILERQ